MSKEAPGYFVMRQQVAKRGGQTPSYVSDFIPTDPINLNFGPGKGTSTKGVGSAWLMGSKTLLGTPSYSQFVYNVLRLRITTGTPNVWFAFTHSRKPGTFDTPFEVTKGDDLTVTDIRTPIYSLLPGTLRVYALGNQGTTSKGKGSTVTWQGFGSSLSGPVGVSMDIYPV